MSPRPLPLVQAAIAVIERRGHFLVSRRKAAAHVGRRWEFPGGKRRVGESWHACLRRELREEMGLEIRITGRMHPIHFRYPDRQVRLEAFRCTIARGVPRSRENQPVRWMTLAQLRRVRIPAANHALIDALQSGC